MKYIFVTGGVVSSLGKGLTAASLGTLLENRGLKETNGDGPESAGTHQFLMELARRSADAMASS